MLGSDHTYWILQNEMSTSFTKRINHFGVMPIFTTEFLSLSESLSLPLVLLDFVYKMM